MRALAVCDSVFCLATASGTHRQWFARLPMSRPRHKVAVQLMAARIDACPQGLNEFFTLPLLYKIKIDSQWGQLTGHAAA